MKIKSLLEKFSYFFESAVVMMIAAFLVTSVVYAATTIGANVNTGGNITVTGNASSTNATSTGYLYVGVGITNPAGFDFGQGDLIISDDFFVNSQATTSASLWIGSAGTTNNISMSGGDLYVQDDAEIDDKLYVTGLTTLARATSTSATSTDYFWVGVPITDPAGWDYTNDLLVSDDFYVNSQATTSASLWVGSGGDAANLNLAGGDLYVQDDVEIDGSATTTSLYLSNDLTIVGHASTTGDLRTDDALIFGGTVHLTTSTATTTDGIFVDMPYNGTATTTVSFGENVGDTTVGCIEMVRSNGTYVRAIIDAGGGGTLAWNIQAGRCHE